MAAGGGVGAEVAAIVGDGASVAVGSGSGVGFGTAVAVGSGAEVGTTVGFAVVLPFVLRVRSLLVLYF